MVAALGGYLILYPNTGVLVELDRRPIVVAVSVSRHLHHNQDEHLLLLLPWVASEGRSALPKSAST